MRIAGKNRAPRRRAALALVIVAGAAGPARADPGAASADTAAAAPSEDAGAAARPPAGDDPASPAPLASPPTGPWLVLPRGAVALSASLEVNYAVRAAYEPISLAPDVYYGVTGAATVGIVHSARAQELLEPGGGLCPRGADAGCERVYDTVGVDYRHAVHRGRIALAGHARAQARSLSPFKLALAVGAAASASRGRLAIEVDPHVSLGLTSRDRGNRSYLNVPVWLRVRVTDGAALALRTGVQGPLSGFGEEYTVPIAPGASYRRGAWEIGAYGGAPELIGAFANPRPRVLIVYVTGLLGV